MPCLSNRRTSGLLPGAVEVAASPEQQHAATSAKRTMRGAPGSSPEVRRFDRHGISFTYPRHWHVTTAALSNGVNPVYRFAVSTVAVRRTGRDLGPCLPGIASQLPRDAVLVYLREALGADRTRSLPRMTERPRTLRLPAPSDRELCGLGPRGRWIPFRERHRAFYLAVYVGPEASPGTRRAVRRLVAGMTIRPR
jgi:hypothetical protein